MYNKDDSPARSSSTMLALNPHEEALHGLCKQILKSRLFRGYYEERRFVQSLNDYRDLVALQYSERELEKVLLDIRKRLHLFYQHKPNIWIGITQGALLGSTSKQLDKLDTHIWAELNDLAFGQYWFSIKSLRFRENEIVVKLKVVRSVSADADTPSHRSRSVTAISTRALTDGSANDPASLTSSSVSVRRRTSSASANTTLQQGPEVPQIDLQDFLALIQDWGVGIKASVYHFMSNDINKTNIVGFLRFFGLLIVSVLSGLLVGIKYLGMFTLRFMFEFSRLTHVLTPIVLKLIDVINKIIGGFYILLAMIWRDAVVNRSAKGRTAPNALEYQRPVMRSIEYNRHASATSNTASPLFTQRDVR